MRRCEGRFAAVGLGVALLCGAVGCGDRRSELKTQFVEPMQKAHGQAAWWDTEALAMDTRIKFGDRREMQASWVFETNGPRVRMEVADGTVVIYDGETAWISPADAALPRARFHVLTWPWFVVTPFKLTGEGVNLELLEPQPLNAEMHPAAKMTFAAGEGDAPDDWYILYADPYNDRLVAQAYIVTYGTSVAAAEEEPHAITYDDWTVVDGVTLARDWHFYNWEAGRGIYGTPLGRVQLSNLAFVTPASGTFTPPEDARELPLP